ncbi:MAG: DUF1570 domain-containing protein [Gemmataceae bacterium]
MKRWLIAVAAMLGLSAACQADYVLIRAIVGGDRSQNQPGTPGAPDAPGTPGTPRPPGGPGAPGQPPGGEGDIPTLGGGQTSAEIDTNAVTVVAVIQAKVKRVPTVPGKPAAVNVTTKWSEGKGFTRLYNGAGVEAYLLPAASPHTRYIAKHDAAFKNRTSDKVFDLADWCLTHGLIEEFTKLMDELVAAKDDQNSSNSEKLRAAVKAYATTKAAVAKPTNDDSYSAFWKARLSARAEQSAHYTLIYNAPVANPPEVKERLGMLEDQMKAFYYWFALKGVALPMPKDKLVAILIDSPDEFRKQRAVVEDEPLVSDGFYAARDHVAVFSTQRIDAPYQMFLRSTQPIWQTGFNKQGLLDGTEKRKVGVLPGDWARYQTLALLEKGLEVEGERAAISHEGSRQLMVASGLMPRTVIPPQWTAFGTAAVFETPKGPFPLAQLEASVAWFSGYGTPSWAYLRQFRDWEQKNQLGDPRTLLTTVVTDGYFNSVLGAKDRQGLLKARTTAWSLAFFLMKERLPGMMRYLQELSALPRDIEVDSRTLLACFARAFDVANSTQDGIDPQKFEELAKNWIAYTKGLVAPGFEYGLDKPAPSTDPNNPAGGQPGGRGEPGRGAPPPKGKGGRG